ncbi:MAG: hypothetical protein M1481_01435 [Candidatus Thermoplasmatota archaeon]|jgi:hypothetical protein|nr:hypothetical protein [Candidatus Thermoplasmatota archaeon]MCL5964010.1 hypothetical protein [Candidatus Thermoplasmatota archaeon]
MKDIGDVKVIISDGLNHNAWLRGRGDQQMKERITCIKYSQCNSIRRIKSKEYGTEP